MKEANSLGRNGCYWNCAGFPTHYVINSQFRFRMCAKHASVYMKAEGLTVRPIEPDLESEVWD